MSEPTPHPAEQALRDYAAQRRAQMPPTELHPATRRLLQGEVARTYSANPAPAAPATPPAAVPWLATWWGRLALGAPALAALVAVFYVLHREREMHLAMTSDPVPPALRETIEPQTGIAPATAAPAAALVMTGEVQSEFKAAADENLALANAAKPEPPPHREEMRRQELVAPAGAASPSDIPPVVAAVPPAPAVPPAREAQLPQVASRAGVENRYGASTSIDAMPTARALPSPAIAATSPPAATAEATTASARLTAGLTRKAAGPQAEQLPPPAESPAAPAMTPPPTTPVGPQSAADGSHLAASDTAKPGLDGLDGPRQQFVSQEDRAALRRNFNSPASPRVLESFHFASSGSLVQLTDADGSVYTGRILGRMESNGSPPQPAKRLTVLFRVEGTSRSLQQTVEFDGQLVLPAAAEPRPKRDGETASEPLPGSLQQGQIHGRAVIGGRTRLEVRAVAAP